MTRISDQAGRALPRLARRTLAQRLGQPGAAAGREDEEILAAPELQARRGVFVTLKLNGCLRGCIGCLTGVEPIVDGVRRYALQAAFHDSRFASLTAAELEQGRIEISILTEPQPLAYDGAADLLAKLVPGRDGVIIRRGPFSATFLPQVWEQLPQPERFLDHLCLKAGLPPDTWQQGGLEVLVYQVQSFAEAEE